MSQMIPNIPEDPEAAVLKMNQTLQMMANQPEIVCQLFHAFTQGGVMPNCETYEMVVNACAAQGLYDCAGLLLEAAETSGVEVGTLLWVCLEGSKDAAYIVRWAPKSLDANVQIPAKCFSVLLRERIATGGLGKAVELFQQLLSVGSAEDAATDALVQSAVELGKLGELTGAMEQAGLSTSRVNHLLEKLVKKTAPVMAAMDMSSPVRPAPGLPAPTTPVSFKLPAPGDEQSFQTALELAEEGRDAHAGLKLLQQSTEAGRVADPATYQRVFDLAIAEGFANEAQQVLYSMRSVHGIDDVSSYVAILTAHTTKGRFDKAEKVFEDMHRQHMAIDNTTWNALLDCATRTGRHDKAWGMFGQMVRQNITVDKFSVSLLLKSITDKTDRSKVRRSIEIVEKFIDTQDQCDDVLFNALLDACCRIKDIVRLERTMNRMKILGIKPSAAVYGTLIKVYGQKNDVHSVNRVWNNMKQADVGINTVTYGCMLDACVKTGCFDKAEEVFAEMKTADQHRNTILYTTMIKSYSKQKKLRRALPMLEEMKTEDVARNCVTFNSLIDAAVRCRDLVAATKLLQQMKDGNILPDLITYSTLTKGFCDQGDIEVALTLLTRLKEQGMQPDEILFNSLLEGCVKANAINRGTELFQEMVTDKVPMSNITFAIMVKLYAGAGRLDQAMTLVQSMEPQFRIKPSNVVFACLVKCCLSANRASTAAQLLLGLPQAARVQPDQLMYASVIPGLVSSGEHDLAMNCLECLATAPLSEQSGARPPNVFAHARNIFEHVASGTPMQKDRARQVLTTMRPVRIFSLEQEKTLENLVRAAPAAAGWTGGEFVPGMAWGSEFAAPAMAWGGEGLAQAAAAHHARAAEALWMATWSEDWQAPATAMTPMRQKSKTTTSPGAASPNVMNILLQNDAGSGEKVLRKGGKKSMTTPVKSPLKMAPMVMNSKLSANIPLEFSVKKAVASEEDKEN